MGRFMRGFPIIAEHKCHVLNLFPWNKDSVVKKPLIVYKAYALAEKITVQDRECKKRRQNNRAYDNPHKYVFGGKKFVCSSIYNGFNANDDKKTNRDAKTYCYINIKILPPYYAALTFRNRLILYLTFISL
jgi:hypothetical protein